jgi:hypothetical protein
MSFSSWIKKFFCCFKPKTLLDLKNEYNAMDDNEVTVSFNTSPHNSTDTKGYSLSDEITYNEIYNR